MGPPRVKEATTPASGVSSCPSAENIGAPWDGGIKPTVSHFPPGIAQPGAGNRVTLTPMSY
ncbi:hypothetical protein Sru01_51070 [Sphaerisporangium rufum]|uniref:Uncharacterized protein n=1 Tax=Sphaerisporangium rufum TaxID=1381558 RepID=A0A919R8G7_9ACTN|nr:hypothetical protein Sru01_51070 [Sphaerisporangium rufum]